MSEVRPYLVLLEIRGGGTPQFQIESVEAYSASEAVHQAFMEADGAYGFTGCGLTLACVGLMPMASGHRIQAILDRIGLLRTPSQGKTA